MDFKWWYPYPFDASKHGAEVDRLIDVLHAFMVVLFVGWAIFFIYCLVRFRHKPGRQAEYELRKFKPSKYIELFVVVFEIVLLLVFSVPVWGRVKNEIPTADKHPLEVRVVAQQFAWNFHYPGKDGKFGTTDPRKGKAAAGNPIGLDKTGAGADDVVVPVFHIPVERPVVARLTSMDVIHGFHIPVLRVQHDIMPGIEVKIWFEAAHIPVWHGTKTLAGNAEIVCAQLCGNSHYKMRGAVQIESQADFDKWYESAGKVELFEEEE